MEKTDNVACQGGCMLNFSSRSWVHVKLLHSKFART